MEINTVEVDVFSSTPRKSEELEQDNQLSSGRKTFSSTTATRERHTISEELAEELADDEPTRTNSRSRQTPDCMQD